MKSSLIITITVISIFSIITVSLIGLYILISLLLSIAVICFMFNRRYEGNKKLKYFQASDFADLRVTTKPFNSNKGQILQGYLYDSRVNSCDKGVIVFVHGLGTGHLAYTTEINTFVQAGFQVFTYDATGCGASQGKTIKGFDQGPIDLKYALRYIRQNMEIKNKPIYLVGHSWGAFSVMNRVDKEDDIAAAVAMCGFISSSAVVAQNLGKAFSAFYPLIVVFLRIYNIIVFGKAANRNALHALNSTRCPVYLLYGKNDKTVLYKKNGLRLKNALSNNSRILFMECANKGHNVYLTEDAENYMASAFNEIKKARKKGSDTADSLYKNLDYNRLTREDNKIMDSVIQFLYKSAKI